MKYEEYKNQTYIIEEKTGKIIKVEEALEKQKQQKLSLRVKIAAICAAIGISGGGYVVNQHISTNDNEVSTESILSDEEIDTITNVENMLKDYQNTAEESTQKELMSEIKDYLNEIDDVKGNSEIENLNKAIAQYFEMTNEENKVLYILKNNDSFIYRLSYKMPEDNNWQVLGKFGEYNIAAELVNLDHQEAIVIPAQTIYRQRVRKFDEETNTYGPWEYTDRYFQGYDVPVDSAVQSWVFQGMTDEQHCTNITDYNSLMVYEIEKNTHDLVICTGIDFDKAKKLVDGHELLLLDQLSSFTKLSYNTVITNEVKDNSKNDSKSINNEIPLNIEMNMEAFNQMSNIDQQQAIIMKAQGETRNSYHIVSDYYKKNGLVEGIPEELVEAYNRLGADNYALAMNEGIEFYNDIANVTVSAESVRGK